MDSEISLELRQIPSMASAYARALLIRRPGLPAGAALPRLRVVARDVPPDERALSLYERMAAFSPRAAVPITWPQLGATPIHACLLGHPAFPLPLVGLVHMRQRIVEFAGIGRADPWDVETWLGGAREVRSGVEFDLHTRALCGGAVAWEGITSILSRRPRGRGAPAPARGGTTQVGASESARRVDPEPTAAVGAGPILRTLHWDIDESIGRRYAALSGDWNPIHLHALVARPFGFPRAIAQGMWLLARCAAEVDRECPSRPRELRVSFRRPVFLPSRVQCVVSSAVAGDGAFFSLRSDRDGSEHLRGSLLPLPAA